MATAAMTGPRPGATAVHDGPGGDAPAARPAEPAAAGCHLPRLAGQRVLLVYGLMGELIAAFRPLGLEYMHRLADWLREQGAEASVVKLRTAEPVAANAALLAEAIRAEGRRVLVVAHSKGGLEALAALLEPDVCARCVGFLAMQSPFFGSPVADAVVGSRPLGAAAGGLARLFRIGSGEGLRDLTTAARHAWMEDRREAIAALLAALPVACVATALEDGAARGRERLHLAAAQWMEKRGCGPNDGLVPVASALIPGAAHVVLPGSHIATVSGGAGRDPVAMLRAGLAALVSAGCPPAA
jgi:hypothetical protein